MIKENFGRPTLDCVTIFVVSIVKMKNWRMYMYFNDAIRAIRKMLENRTKLGDYVRLSVKCRKFALEDIELLWPSPSRPLTNTISRT